MREVALWLWIVGASALCGSVGCEQRSVGSPSVDAQTLPDAGEGTDADSGPACEPPCAAPYVCDETTGACRCPAGLCCEPWDCPDQQCELRPTERYRFTAQDSEGVLYDCTAPGEYAPAGSHWNIEVSGTITDADVAGFGLAVDSGPDLWVTHNLPPDVGLCLWPGRSVTLQMAWYSDFDDPQRCIQELLVSAYYPLVHAVDGSTGFMGGNILVDTRDLECDAEPGPCGTPTVYALEFWMFDNFLLLYQGYESEFTEYGGTYRALNLRSHYSGECEDDFNYAVSVRRVCDEE